MVGGIEEATQAGGGGEDRECGFVMKTMVRSLADCVGCGYGEDISVCG